MDLLIKGIEMPKSCEDCFACYELSWESFDYCNILKASTIRGKRRKDCPIVEVKEGKWTEFEEGVYECSECHELYILDDTPMAHKYHFCPNCGSRMEVEHGLAD